MAPGGAEAGPRGMSDGRADEEVILGFWALCEHPVTADKLAATTTAPHSRGR